MPTVHVYSPGQLDSRASAPVLDGFVKAVRGLTSSQLEAHQGWKMYDKRSRAFSGMFYPEDLWPIAVLLNVCITLLLQYPERESGNLWSLPLT